MKVLLFLVVFLLISPSVKADDLYIREFYGASFVLIIVKNVSVLHSTNGHFYYYLTCHDSIRKKVDVGSIAKIFWKPFDPNKKQNI